jgi:hypothetical protein
MEGSMFTSESTFCLLSRWCKCSSSSHYCCCFSCSWYWSMSFLIFWYSSELWRAQLCTGQCALPSSLPDVLAGTLVTPRAPTPTHRCSSRSGRGAGQWLTVATSLLLACLLLPPPPWAAAPVLGWSPFPASGIGGACQAQPSAALTHLSARLKSSATSLMSCVASFFNIFSSLTP